MAKEDNLKSWKPGQSGNPAGRPKGTRNRAKIYEEILDLVAPDVLLDNFKERHELPVGADLAGMTIADLVAMGVAIRAAMTGDPSAAKEAMDSTYGKIADKQELTGKDGGPIETKPLTETDEEIINRYMANQGRGSKTEEPKE